MKAEFINPHYWLAVTERRHAEVHSPWFDGTTQPARIGWYDRCFVDGTFRQWWDGAQWLSYYRGPAHWRQVGDYPAWRGLAAEASPLTANASEPVQAG